jgi:hypothetical protein
VEGDNEIGKGNALIRFYLKRDPSNMTDTQWARAVSDIQYCLQVEKRMTGAAMADILSLIQK